MPLKTPLPEKLNKNYLNDTFIALALNQLIDVVAELTEEVEGKQGAANAEEFLAPLNPTLKTELLAEIRRRRRDPSEVITTVVPLTEVEAIINRLIP